MTLAAALKAANPTLTINPRLLRNVNNAIARDHGEIIDGIYHQLCRTCSSKLPANQNHWFRDKTSPLGIRGPCMACRNRGNRALYKKKNKKPHQTAIGGGITHFDYTTPPTNENSETFPAWTPILSRDTIDRYVKAGKFRWAGGTLEAKCTACPEDESWWPLDTEFFRYYASRKSALKLDRICLSCRSTARRENDARKWAKQGE